MSYLFRRGHGRGCVWRTFEKEKAPLYPRRGPGHCRALSNFVHAQSCPIEDLIQGETALAHHFSQRLRVGTVWALSFRGHRSRRRIEGDHGARLGLYQGEATRERLPRLPECILPRCIQNYDSSLKAQGRQRASVVRQSQCLDSDIGGTIYPGVYRDKIVFAFQLEAVTTEIDERRGAWTRVGGLIQKIPKRPL